MNDMAVQRMADAFARGKPGRLTTEQKQTVAFALRALHPSSPSRDWIAGFAACAYLMSGRYEDYARERDAAIAKATGNKSQEV